MKKFAIALIAIILCVTMFMCGALYAITRSTIWAEDNAIYIDCFGQIWEHGRE